MKKFALIIGSIIIFVSIPVVVFLAQRSAELRSKAAPSTSLSLSPSTKEIAVNGSFTVNVQIDTGSNQIISGDFYFTYDPEMLDCTGIALGPFMSGANEIMKNIDSVTGVIRESFYVTKADARTGSGTIATLTFKGKAPGTSFVQADSNKTILGGLPDIANVWTKTLVKGTYTVVSAVTLTPTSTPQATLSPTPTDEDNEDSTPTNTPLPANSPTPTSGTGGSQVYAFTITYPPNGGTVTTSKPTIKGTGTPESTVTIVLSGGLSVTGVTTTSSSGNWQYTVNTPLSDGSYTLSATEQNLDGSTRSISSTFSVNTTPVPVTGRGETTFILLSAAAAFLILGLGLAL